MADITWEEMKELATSKVVGLPEEYSRRLKFELTEVEKQGAIAKFNQYYNEGKRFQSDGNNLLFLWLLGLVSDDPLAGRKEPILNTVKAAEVAKFKTEHGFVPSDLRKDPDMPDVDVDCLPEARDPIKEYAISQYGTDVSDGYGSVCSVGTWTTYKFKSAIIDVCDATGLVDKTEAYELTTNLPEDVDDVKDGGKSVCKGHTIDEKTGEKVECRTSHDGTKCPNCGSTDTENPTIGQLLKEHEKLREFARSYPKVISLATRLVGRIRNMGMHAGALIITDRPLYGNIPMAKSSNKGYWISMWTEGRNTQLSKFGYQKWDLLGLKTLKYIYTCCQLIEQNRGISFGKSMDGWDDIDPTKNRAGYFFDRKGKKVYIDLNDKHVLRLANEMKTDGVFQFDTDLAKSILANGVRNFEDLMLFNAMGHPGPMASIPEAVANRDDSRGRWRKKLHPDILEVLNDTHGVIVYQEQLQAIWQKIAYFTAPEAQDARKAVAKKWADKLKPVEKKWVIGASKVLGEAEAREWWEKMKTFGRYAFNRSHAVSYCLVAHRCLWLKAHFAPEWWASVMSECHPDKLVRYMGVARSEGWKPTSTTYAGTQPPKKKVRGVKFETTNVENLTADFTVTGDVVNQGLIGIKGIGDTTAPLWEGRSTFTTLDEFIAEKGKKKTVMEAFIKLGAFRRFEGYRNARATWEYYRYKYCTGKDITQLKREIKQKLLNKEGWTEEAVQEERQRQIDEYKKLYPKRRKIPPKLEKWNPKPDDSSEKVMALYEEDFTLQEVLEFEKKYLGYYLHSPLDLYAIEGNCTIEDAKLVAKNGGEPKLEVVITDLEFSISRNKKPYARVFVSDGIQNALVLIFSRELGIQDENNLVPGSGVQMIVEYDEKRGTFTLARGEIIIRLLQRGWDS